MPRRHDGFHGHQRQDSHTTQLIPLELDDYESPRHNRLGGDIAIQLR